MVAGDTLSIIAGKLLGDVARWPDIYDLAGNQAAVGAEPDAIAPGLTADPGALRRISAARLRRR